MDDTAFETVLRRHLKHLPAGRELLPDDSLKKLGLDSMQAVELLFDLEDELGVTLPDDVMTGDTFATPRSLHDVIRETASAS